MKNDGSSKTNYFIYFAVLSTNLIAFSTGGCFSWTSPVILKFASHDPSINPISRPITTFEAAWIVSIMNIGLISGPPISAFCTKKLGKKMTLLIVSSPLLAAHVLCGFATNVWIFLGARYLMGLASGCIWTVLPTFIAEISEDRNRGLLGCLVGVMSSAGSLFIYLVGPFLSMKWFSLINFCPLILFYILFVVFVPQSPYDLVMQNKHQQAEDHLSRLRRSTGLQVQKELSLIVKSVISSTTRGDHSFKDLFRVKGLLRALIICIGLMTCQQLSGILAVISYTQTIFEIAGSSLPSAFSAIIVGVVSLVSTIVSCQLIDKLGRKMLLTSSCLLSFLSLLALGFYFYLQEHGMSVDGVTWLPIVSLVVYMFAFNFGLIVLPWVVLGEVFPTNVKSMATSLVSLISYCPSFTVTMCFPYLVEGFGMAGTFWIFGGIMGLGTIFCIVVVPETKGKSFDDIQVMLNR